jgi:hypothetical protein
MRSKSNRVLVALVAALALGALTAGPALASGLPEFKPGAKESFPVSFTGSGGSASWETPGYSFTCTTTSMVGTISGAKTITKDTLVFTGCKVQGKTCGSEGAKNNEEIKTELLEGTLVYISKTAKTVGIDFKPESGAYWTKLRCFGGTSKIRGSIVMSITTVNKLQSNFTLKVLKAYEGMEAENLGNELFGPLSWEFENSLTTNKNVEIKA